MTLPFHYPHNYNIYVQYMRIVYVQATLSNRASSPSAATQTADMFHTDQMLVRTAQMTWQRLQHCREVTIVAIRSLWTEKIDWKEKDLTGFESPIKNWFQHDTQAVGTSSRRCLLCWKMRLVLLSSGNWTHPSESPFRYPIFQKQCLSYKTSMP